MKLIWVLCEDGSKKEEEEGRQTIFSHFSVISLAISLVLFILCHFYMHLSIINFILSCKCVCMLHLFPTVGYCSFYNDMRRVNGTWRVDDDKLISLLLRAVHTGSYCNITTMIKDIWEEILFYFSQKKGLAAIDLNYVLTQVH